MPTSTIANIVGALPLIGATFLIGLVVVIFSALGSAWPLAAAELVTEATGTVASGWSLVDCRRHRHSLEAIDLY